MLNEEKFIQEFFDRFQKIEHLILSIIYPEHKNMFAKFNIKFDELSKVDSRFNSIQSYVENLNSKIDEGKKDFLSSFYSLEKKFESLSNDVSRNQRESQDRFLSIESLLKSLKDSNEEPRRKIEYISQKLESVNEYLESIKFLKSSMEEIKKDLEGKINSSSQIVSSHDESILKIEKSKSALQSNIDEVQYSLQNLRKEFSENLETLSKNLFVQKNDILDQIFQKIKNVDNCIEERISKISFPVQEEQNLSKEVMNQILLYSKDVSNCMVKSENLHTQYKILDKKLEKLIEEIKK